MRLNNSSTAHHPPLQDGSDAPQQRGSGVPPLNPQPIPKRRRILQMCAVDFTARQFLQPLTAALECEGHAVAVACARGPWFDELDTKGFRMIENPISRSANLWAHTKSLFHTYHLLRREKIDILHVHTPIAALIGRLAGRSARTPLIIYTAHGFYFHENSRPLTRRALVFLEKIGAACGDFIMTVSDEDRNAAINLGITKPHQVETIYNGVDTAHYDPARFTAADRAQYRAAHGIPPDAPVIGIMGRLVREKGIFEFFEAAADVLKTHPDCWFLIVGDLLPSDYDGKRHELTHHVQATGVSHRTIFTGMVDDPAPHLNAMDIFCLPSYREGMPISLLEAMAMALPCITTDIRGCREEVVNSQTGWIIPAKNAPALTEKMNWLLTNPDTAQTMGKAGRHRVLEKFDIRNVIEHQLQIYRKLIQQHIK